MASTAEHHGCAVNRKPIWELGCLHAVSILFIKIRSGYDPFHLVDILITYFRILTDKGKGNTKVIWNVVLTGVHWAESTIADICFIFSSITLECSSSRSITDWGVYGPYTVAEYPLYIFEVSWRHRIVSPIILSIFQILIGTLKIYRSESSLVSSSFCDWKPFVCSCSLFGSKNTCSLAAGFAYMVLVVTDWLTTLP